MEIDQRIKNHREGKADRYSNGIRCEIDWKQRVMWKRIIFRNLSLCMQDSQLKVLDIGTGPGFFPIILGEEGYAVTGIDSTAKMLKCAKENAEREGIQATFQLMNYQHLDFFDNTFDLIICHNLTWILEYPEAAYKEWRRVLKPGGRLLIFDAKWNRYIFDPELQQAYAAIEEEGRKKYGRAIYDLCYMKEFKAISRNFPMVKHNRPTWDLQTLINLGFTKVFAELDLSKEIGNEMQQMSHRLTSLFLVGAEK